jgi:16S rRNA (uracil1498-N3)-methyltransferase
VKQFLLPGSYAGEERYTLTGGDFRHLIMVLRLAPGAAIPARDARGASYDMRILEVDEHACSVRLTRRPEVSGAGAVTAGHARTRIILLQCLPKGRKIDLIVRQATEAGVTRIVPLESEHSLVRPGNRDGRAERLWRIAREAVQQSGTPAMPEIDEPRSLASLFERGEDWGTALVFHEKPVDGKPLHDLLAGTPGTVSVLIGPEGGLSESEIARVTGAGFQPVHFDTGVLRVETAATFALGAVMTILQERDAWRPARAE